MITLEIKKIIEENPLALATCNKNNEPHVIAVADVKIKDNKIIVTDNCMIKTTDNIKENNKISLVVWNDDWKGYIIEGTAEYFKEGDWKDFVKLLKENKGEPCKGAIVIVPERIKPIG